MATTINTTTQEQAIDALCQNLIQGVRQVVKCTESALPQVSQVMKARMRAFLFGDEYADARECLVLGSLHQGYVMGLLVADTVSDLLAIPEVSKR